MFVISKFCDQIAVWLAGVAVLLELVLVVHGTPQPVRNLRVTLRGKAYDVDESVLTVRDLQQQVQAKSGAAEPPTVLLDDGRRLEPDDVLSASGVTDGAQLHLIPAGASSSGSGSSSGSKKAKAAASSAGVATSATATAADAGLPSVDAAMQEYLKQAGVDTDQLSELVKGMGGGLGGEGGGLPSMKESLDMMNGMMKSELFQSYMSDPEKLEQSRQMILGNPMLKSLMAGMPGMEDVLNDPDAWREAMQAAASAYQNMDPDMLASMLSGTAGGLGGAGGMPPGLFDGTLDQSAAALALDELDEDE